MKTNIKICGITRNSYARAAADAGADYIGVIVDIKESPRNVSLIKAAEILKSSSLPTVVLLEKAINDIIKTASFLNPYAIQLIGKYTPDDIQHLKKKLNCKIWKTISIPKTGTNKEAYQSLLKLINNYKNAGTDAIILDTLVPKKKGGTGQTCDWDTAEKLMSDISIPLFLAGGINPENVCDAVIKVRPYGIDLSSGVEKAPAEKDPEKILKLVNNVKNI
jgi:phosphoribosylanthranilate isomerase